jgi:predicted flavoprotein YhiN
MGSYLVNNADFKVHKVSLQYTPNKKEDKAALNFHLTQREKQSISSSLNSKLNQDHLQQIVNLLNAQHP